MIILISNINNVQCIPPPPTKRLVRLRRLMVRLVVILIPLQIIFKTSTNMSLILIHYCHHKSHHQPHESHKFLGGGVCTKHGYSYFQDYTVKSLTKSLLSLTSLLVWEVYHTWLILFQRLTMRSVPPSPHQELVRLRRLMVRLVVILIPLHIILKVSRNKSDNWYCHYEPPESHKSFAEGGGVNLISKILIISQSSPIALSVS